MALPLSLAITACLATVGGGIPNLMVDQIFTDAYTKIFNVYIVQPDTSELTLAGLRNLARIDPKLTVLRNTDGVTILYAGEEIRSFPTPARGDFYGWGEVTASSLQAAHGRSAALKAAGIRTLYDTIFDGVLAELDDHSTYRAPGRSQETGPAGRSESGSLGVTFSVSAGVAPIHFVGDDTPAQSAGLTSKHSILAIDGAIVAGRTYGEVLDALDGPVGSEVRLTVLRAGGTEPSIITLRRKLVALSPVNYRLLGDVAYLRIGQFPPGTVQAVRQAVERAHRDLGEGLKGFVVDLRGNPGGRLDQGVGVADLFLGTGRISSTYGRHADSDQEFTADREDLSAGLRLTILVNGASVGASEIVAAALQDSGRAVVIGTVTDGGGFIQTVLRLRNDGEIALTWALLQAPSSYTLLGRGVLPDVCTSAGDADIARVIGWLRSGALPFPISVQQAYVDPWDRVEVEEFRALCPARFDEPDVDLEAALRLLRDPKLYSRARGGQGV